MANPSSDLVRLKADATYEVTTMWSYVVSAFRRTVIASLLALLATTGLAAQQADRARTEALARRAAERLQALQREADQLVAAESTLLNELRRLEVERQIKTEELSRLNAEAEATTIELDETTTRIDALEVQEEAERPDLQSRLVEIYKLGRARYLRLLLSTADVRQIGRASRMVGALARADRLRIAAHQQTLDALKTARRDLEIRNRRLLALRGDAERAERAAVEAARVHDARVRDIDQRRDLNAQLAGELQTAQQKLQATLRDLAAGAAVAEPAPLPFRAFRGALDWPVSGDLRRRFGRGTTPRSAPSSGIEISAGEGTPVQAVHEGVVAFADPFTGFGNLVIVDHGGQTFSLYGDLLDVAVKRGARVERGQAVGTVGAAPASPTGLYFELRIDGRPVDPLQWLKRR